MPASAGIKRNAYFFSYCLQSFVHCYYLKVMLLSCCEEQAIRKTNVVSKNVLLIDCMSLDDALDRGHNERAFLDDMMIVICSQLFQGFFLGEI